MSPNLPEEIGEKGLNRGKVMKINYRVLLWVVLYSIAIPVILSNIWSPTLFGIAMILLVIIYHVFFPLQVGRLARAFVKFLESFLLAYVIPVLIVFISVKLIHYERTSQLLPILPGIIFFSLFLPLAFISGIRRSLSMETPASIKEDILKIVPAYITIALRNMRKRPLTTSFTAVSLISIILATMLFVSVASAPVLVESSKTLSNSYENTIVVKGELEKIQLEAGKQTMIPSMIPKTIIYKTSLMGNVSRSSMLYMDIYPQAHLRCSGRSIPMQCVYSLIGSNTSYDYIVFKNAIKVGLLPSISGSEIAVSESFSKSFNLTIGSVIELEIDITGLRLPVVISGIFYDDAIISIRDLDGSNIHPSVKTYAPEYREEPLPPEFTFIVSLPIANLMKLPVRKLTLHMFSNVDVFKIAKEFADSTKTPGIVVEAINGRRLSFFYFSTSHIVYNMNFLFIVSALAFLITINTILSNVYERQRELSTFSSLGASPSVILLSVIIESLILGVISGVAGSILSFFVIMFAEKTKYATTSLILKATFSIDKLLLGVGLASLASTLAAIIPAHKASLMVTPSLRRKWVPSVKKKLSKDIYKEYFNIKLSWSEFDDLLNYLKERLNVKSGLVSTSDIKIIEKLFSDGRYLKYIFLKYTIIGEQAIVVDVLTTVQGRGRKDSYGPEEVLMTAIPVFPLFKGKRKGVYAYEALSRVREAILEWKLKKAM